VGLIASLHLLTPLLLTGVPTGMPLDVPVDPGHNQAQQWLVDELSKPQYAAAQPSWFDLLVQAIMGWFASLKITGGGAAQWPLIVTVVVVIAAAIAAAYLIFGPPRLGRRSESPGALFGADDNRNSASLRREADRAAAAGDWATATLEMFRCIARSLSERTLVAVLPGTTAHGFAVKAATPFPDFGERFRSVAEKFDAVRYLGAAGSESSYNEIAALEAALRLARPVILEPMGATA
jgi:hypothetical protein